MSTQLRHALIYQVHNIKMHNMVSHIYSCWLIKAQQCGLLQGLTDHEVDDDREEQERDESQRDDIGEDLGHKVRGDTIVPTAILVTV